MNTCSFNNNDDDNTFSLSLLYAEPFAKFLTDIISFYYQKNSMKEEYFTFYKWPIREVNLPKVTKYIRDEIVSDSEAILLTTTLYIKVQIQETWENKNSHVHNFTNPREHCSHFDIFHSGIVCFCFYHCHTLYIISYTIDPVYYNTNKQEVQELNDAWKSP